MIPKIIHYCWFGGNELSELATKCVESWQKHCPDYQIKRWDEQNFNIECNQYVKQAYDAKKWAFITDYVRLYALYNVGGIYMDTDVELIRNIDIFLDYDGFTGFENDECVSTAIMGARSGHSWIQYLLGYYKDKEFVKNDGTFDTTTNVAIITDMMCRKYNLIRNNTFQLIEDKVAIFPKDYFCPKSYVTGEINLSENSYCIHNFSGSWLTDKQKKEIARRHFFIKLIGPKLGIKLSENINKCIRIPQYINENGVYAAIKKIKIL